MKQYRTTFQYHWVTFDGKQLHNTDLHSNLVDLLWYLYTDPRFIALYSNSNGVKIEL